MMTRPPLDAGAPVRSGSAAGARPGHAVAARRLPSGRAVVGGLLIGVSMIAAVALSRSATSPETVPVVVATTAIRPGDALGEHNLVAVDLALPDQLLATTYADPAALAGTVARSHLAPDEIVQRGGVIEATSAQRSAAPAREVSLRIDADRALEGRLEAGDRVDVLATYGNGLEALTFVVLADAPVLSVARSEGGVTSGRSIVLTLALAERAQTIELAHAVDNADVTVVRTTTADRSDSHPGRPYRPIVPDGDDGGRP